MQTMQDVHDPAHRSALLQALLVYVPQDGTITPSQTTFVARAICRQHLLQEASVDDARASKAVDQWITHVISLLDDYKVTTRQAALHLLKIAASEIRAARFLDQFGTWFTKVQPICFSSSTGAPTPVHLRVAACACIASVIRRSSGLSHVPGLRRDMAALLAKFMPLTIRTLNDVSQLPPEDQAPIASALIEVAFAAAASHPTTLRPCGEALQKCLAKLLLPGASDSSDAKSRIPLEVHLQAARSLSLMPHIPGTAAAWSDLARQVLVAVHNEVKMLYDGAESSGADSGLRELDADSLPTVLVPPAPTGSRPSVCLPRVKVLLGCLTALLRGSFPVPVPLPNRAVVALIERLLAVDTGSKRSDVTFAARGMELSAILPEVHTLALGLLTCMLETPHFSVVTLGNKVGRLLVECLRRSGPRAGPAGGLPAVTCCSVRCSLYAACAALLRRLGAASALLLAPPLVAQTVRDLHLAVFVPQQRPGPADAAAEGLDAAAQVLEAGPASKKRKKGGAGAAAYAAAGARTGPGEVVGAPSGGAGALTEAAAAALEALLSAAGAQLPEIRRTEVDNAVLQLALQVVPKRSTFSESLVLACLRALVAACLAPRLHQPPCLPPALALLSSVQATGRGALAAYAAQGLLALEPLLHPRAGALAAAAPPPPMGAMLSTISAAMPGGSEGGDTWAEVDEVLRPKVAPPAAELPGGGAMQPAAAPSVAAPGVPRGGLMYGAPFGGAAGRLSTTRVESAAPVASTSKADAPEAEQQRGSVASGGKQAQAHVPPAVPAPEHAAHISKAPVPEMTNGGKAVESVGGSRGGAAKAAAGEPVWSSGLDDMEADGDTSAPAHEKGSAADAAPMVADDDDDDADSEGDMPDIVLGDADEDDDEESGSDSDSADDDEGDDGDEDDEFEDAD